MTPASNVTILLQTSDLSLMMVSFYEVWKHSFWNVCHFFFRISAAEVRAENAERAATRLQGEADTLQCGLLQEKQRAKRMEEDMQGLVSSLENI